MVYVCILKGNPPINFIIIVTIFSPDLCYFPLVFYTGFLSFFFSWISYDSNGDIFNAGNMIKKYAAWA